MAAPLLERQFFAKGQRIVSEGDEAYVAYIIQSGRARVFSQKDKQKIELSILDAGQIFGETALIRDTVRTASVEAAEDCTLIVITREVFKHKIEKSDPTIKAVVTMLTNRMLKSNDEIMKAKGVNINSFIALLNQLFVDIVSAMPVAEQDAFRAEAFPVMRQMVKVIEKYRDKLE